MMAPDQSHVKSSVPTARHCGGQPRARQYSTMILSGSSEIDTKVKTFSGGADDYMTVCTIPTTAACATVPSAI